jgi:beta-galactosidase GanA
MMLYSGEFHPFRLPVPGLWLDIFQKIKALGFNTASFYTNWGLLEGKQGQVIETGIWNLEQFFSAASEAGIYLIARPGPYINAEVSAGGLPGWVLRLKSVLRSNSPEYLNATALYVSRISQIIARAQITNGGPVILLQPENEYSMWPGVSGSSFPSQMNKEYIDNVNKQYREAGIVVPFINNDNNILGSFAPGTGVGAVDIYGIDAYPLKYDCRLIWILE